MVNMIRKTIKGILITIGSIVLLAVVIAACNGGETEEIKESGNSNSNSQEESQEESQSSDEELQPEQPPTDPKLKDFKLSPKVTEQQCFGSAGCNVTFEIDLEYRGSEPVSEEYRITYEVSGTESDIIDNLTVHSDGTFSSTEHYVSTSSEDSSIKIKPTEIEKL